MHGSFQLRWSISSGNLSDNICQIFQSWTSAPEKRKKICSIEWWKTLKCFKSFNIQLGHKMFLNVKSMVKAFGLYWGGIKFESHSTQHCWALNEVFIPSLVTWSVTKNKKESAKQKEQWCAVRPLRPWASHFETTASSRPFGCKHGTIACYGKKVYPKAQKHTDLEKQNCQFGVHLLFYSRLADLFEFLSTCWVTYCLIFVRVFILFLDAAGKHLHIKNVRVFCKLP